MKVDEAAYGSVTYPLYPVDTQTAHLVGRVMTYIAPSKCRNLPKNRRIVPASGKPASEMAVWRDGFGVGFFFGGIFIEVLFLALTWLKG